MYTFYVLIIVVASVNCCRLHNNIVQCTSVSDIQNNGKTSWRHIEANNYNNESLKILPKNVFKKSPNLAQIRIDGLLSDIDKGAFDNLAQLTHLILYSNDLREIKTGCFENLHVRYLSFVNNGIITLHKGCFRNNNELVQLLIERNFIPVLTEGVFNNLKLKKLLLKENNIRVIEEKTFINMPNLILLDLHENKLTSFDSKTILGENLSLKKLWLYNNYLSRVPAEYLNSLPSLESINLSQNQITTIEPNAFQNLRNVTLLEISNNRLETISPQAFPEGLQSVSKLFIHNNRLMFLSTDVLTKFPNLVFVRFGGNPWQCPCIYNLIAWLNNKKIQYPCDKEYFMGQRPVCVVSIENSTECVYDVNKNRDNIRNYLEAIREYPDTKLCGI